MSVKLIIFDLDGTLIDTGADIRTALNYAIAPLGIKPISESQTREFIGEGVSRLIEKATGPGHIGTREKTIQRFMEYYEMHLMDRSNPYPFVRNILESLKSIRKVVISNKRERLVIKLLTEFNLIEFFEIARGSAQGIKKKPSPDQVNRILNQMGVHEQEAIIVGDSAIDIQTGRNAGLATIGVTYGYGSEADLRGATYRIDSFSELVPLLYSHRELLERRREIRHSIPNIYRTYIELSIRIADDDIPMTLTGFSEHGLRFRCPVPFDRDTTRLATISMPKSLTKVIPLTLGIRHCVESDGAYDIGAEIQEVGSEVWFKVFRKILTFISEREGDVF